MQGDAFIEDIVQRDRGIEYDLGEIIKIEIAIRIDEFGEVDAAEKARAGIWEYLYSV